MSAKIRPITLNGQTRYVVEFGQDFMLFNHMSLAIL